jgi:photosystem II stability/assembly factor-like uncharacterized protein
MTAGNSDSHKPFVYVGQAGETALGRTVRSGLYRMLDGDDQWELLTNGLPESPAIRAISIHPQQPETVFVGTQQGPYRTDDHGDHWEKVNVPDHGLPVWSILFHPRDSKVMFAGYESSEIYRSDDGGEQWQQLPVSVRFPEVTVAPGANLAKRVLQMSASTSNPDELYGAIEVGGIIRTLDGGDHWDQLSHGQYVNDDYVDMHGVLASSFHPGVILSIGRAGMFRSVDKGDHWIRVPIEVLNEKGQTYCRQIREVPGDSKTIWVAAGANFISDLGTLFRSPDGGMNWDRIDFGEQPKSTLFGLAINERNPNVMYCASSGGEVWGSHDSGDSWGTYHLPEGTDQVYCMACG